MKHRTVAGLGLLFAYLAPSRLSGQSLPKEWKTAISGTMAKPKASGTPGFGSKVDSLPVSGITWTINCTAPVSCARMLARVLLGGDTPQAGDTAFVEAREGQNERQVVLDLIGGEAGKHAKLELVLDSTAAQPVVLHAEVEFVSPRENEARTGIAVDPRCVENLPTAPRDLKDKGYTPHFRADVLGNVWVRPEYPIDDRDRVLVTVIAKQEAVPQLRVTRHSAFRAVGGISILGAGTEIPAILRQSEEEGKVTTLGCTTVTLADFASGKGEVEIAFVDDKGEGHVLGGFEFAVNPTYTGAFSLGAIRTPLLDPEFGLAFNGTDTVITTKTDGRPGDEKRAHRILYSVMYTYYMWGRRDIEKPRPLWQRVNPMIGVVLNDIPKNFIAGASVDLFEGVFLHAGAHAGKVRDLDPKSGLTVGQEYKGTVEQLPIIRRWRTKFFLGVTVDLRAAAELFKAAVGAAGS